MHPIDSLRGLSRTFGAAAPDAKLRLLAEISACRKLSRRRLLLLHDTLLFMQAYPDGPAVLAAVQQAVAGLERWARQLPDAEAAAANTGLPGAVHGAPFSFAVSRFLVRTAPDCVEIDWSDPDELSRLHEVLAALLVGAETPSLDDVELDTRRWLAAANQRPGRSHLAFVLELFARSGLDPAMRATLFESCAVPIRYTLDRPGAALAEATRRPRRVHYQRAGLDRSRHPLEPRIRRPLPRVEHVSPGEGRRWIELCLRTLCARNLEIYPLSYGDPSQVRRIPCGRGIEVILAGVPLEHRAALEALFFFAVFQNGVPIAYGPASLLLRCSEMGINLFPEFRGGEIRSIYAQVMRVLYHVLGVRYFFVPSYGMGRRNDEAIDSGAFWFYRKLGFLPTNPAVEHLALDEERRMQRQPGHRSDRRMLRRLADTRAYLDLSGGRCRPVDAVQLALRVTHRIDREFGGERARAARCCERQLTRDLAIPTPASWSPTQRLARRMLAPVLTSIPDLGSWPASARRALIGVIRAKAAADEVEFAAALAAHPECGRALRDLAEAAPRAASVPRG